MIDMELDLRLRNFAMDFAIRSKEPGWTQNQVVAHAQAYYQFLRGASEAHFPKFDFESVKLRPL